MNKTFKTTVLGVGPFCIEFPDGEIITTRTESRQRILSLAPELLEALESAIELSRLAIADGWIRYDFLMAMSGHIPGYDKRIDHIHEVISKANGPQS